MNWPQTCSVRVHEGKEIAPKRRQLTFLRTEGSTGVSKKYRPRAVSIPRRTPGRFNAIQRHSMHNLSLQRLSICQKQKGQMTLNVKSQDRKHTKPHTWAKRRLGQDDGPSFACYFLCQTAESHQTGVDGVKHMRGCHLTVDNTQSHCCARYLQESQQLCLTPTTKKW